MPIQTLAQMQNFFTSQSFQTFKQVAGIVVSDIYPDLGTKIDILAGKDGAESFWRELPPNNPLSKLAEQNGLLVSKQLAEASAVLNDIAALATSIHALFSKRPRVSAQRTDISSLPNELLARIFEEATSQAFGFTAISETLSHVCRHWRFIALGLPTLWAEADLSHCQEKRDVFLERSRNAPLTVDIKGLGIVYHDRLCDAINDIVPLTERWSRLRFFIEDDFHARVDVLSFMGEEHSALNVPLLTDLEVDYSSENDLLEELGEEDVFFYSKWKMPNLRSLNVKGCLSPHRQLHDMTFGTNLIQCSLELNFDIETLSNACWDFLRNHPSLEEFELKISCEVNGWDTFIPITLPNLKTLVVGLGRYITDSNGARKTMVNFMNALDMPFLSKLVLSLEDCMSIRINGWIFDFLQRSSYPNLVDLSLLFMPNPAYDMSKALMAILSDRTPNIRNLAIFTPTKQLGVPPSSSLSQYLPHLCKVKLMHCNAGHTSTDKNLMEDILRLTRKKVDNGWDNSEGLEIVQYDIRQSELMKRTFSK